MWRKVISHELPQRSQIVKTLETQPKRFGSRFSIAFSSQKPAKAGGPMNRFSQCGWVLGRTRILPDVRRQRFPFGFFKKHCVGHVRRLTSQLGQVENTPCDHHVNRQAGLDPIGMAQLPVFQLATVFQRPVIHFNPPTPRIPSQFLHRFLKR